MRRRDDFVRASWVVSTQWQRRVATPYARDVPSLTLAHDSTHQDWLYSQFTAVSLPPLPLVCKHVPLGILAVLVDGNTRGKNPGEEIKEYQTAVTRTAQGKQAAAAALSKKAAGHRRLIWENRGEQQQSEEERLFQFCYGGRRRGVCKRF